MTWEETIKFIRTQTAYNDLVKFAYFEENLELNVERFKNGEEFSETKKIIASAITNNSCSKIMDIGSGNGITAIAFALEGFQVDAVEPDPSETIGAGAIRKLKKIYKLDNLNVHEAFAENLNFPDNHFDIVYARQCMHHAHDLQQFLNESFRVLKKGGILLTVRDHVVFNDEDKQWFLNAHPLQKFYGGENAYTVEAYQSAMVNAGFEVKNVLKHFDSVINYFPITKIDKENRTQEFENLINDIVNKKIGGLAKIVFFKKIISSYIRGKLKPPYDEKLIPGRMYTFLARKF
jgi:ubiquinone/menaquinone biosynthesis C-methylase UbiE